MNDQSATILLNRQQVRSLLTIDECIGAVERVFRLQGEGNQPPPGILGVHGKDGGFHIKAGLLKESRTYFVAKVNANFPQNRAQHGLPTIQGVIILSDGENGRPLALMDSMEITMQRTGAATAVAAKHLSRPDASIVTICGAGSQGRIQLRSLMCVRSVKQVFIYDLDPDVARKMADEFSSELLCEPVTSAGISNSLRKSHICVTCTPSRRAFVMHGDITPGTFIAAVGADSEEKQELDPQLFVSTKVVADSLDQCAIVGDLHHALGAGLLRKADVYAELGEIVAGKKQGRTSKEEITIFDSTGVAYEDAAAALLVYEKALANGVGTAVKFS